MSAAPITAHPDYAEGYYDALDMVSLFDDASPEYRAGWEAAWAAKEILRNAGFTQNGPRDFSKTTAIEVSQ